MYQEQPGYKIMFNTLRAMYQNHPIRVDIAGSVESIYDITKDDLYLCYENVLSSFKYGVIRSGRC